MRGLGLYLLRLAGLASLAALAVILVGYELLYRWIDWRIVQRVGREGWDRLMAGEGSAAEKAIEASYNWTLSPWVTAMVVGLGLALAAAIGWWFGRPMIARLAEFRDVAQAVRKGDLSARIPPPARGFNELESFARDFNALVARAERAEREMRGSAAAIAHELRTPLTVMQGRLTGMIDGVFPADPAGLSIVQRQVGLLTRLVEDLRFLTLFDTGRMSFSTRPVDLARVVADELAADAGVGPTIDTALQEVWVQADAPRLTQALRALLTNAARHAGGVDRVEVARIGDAAVLRVLDRGPGIPEADAERIFNRFWRMEEGSDARGSGLGLSVVRAIARGHGGTVRALPRPGGGMIFELRLPVLAGPTAEEASTESP